MMIMALMIMMVTTIVRMMSEAVNSKAFWICAVVSTGEQMDNLLWSIQKFPANDGHISNLTRLVFGKADTADTTPGPRPIAMNYSPNWNMEQ